MRGKKDENKTKIKKTSKHENNLHAHLSEYGFKKLEHVYKIEYYTAI